MLLLPFVLQELPWPGGRTSEATRGPAHCKPAAELQRPAPAAAAAAAAQPGGAQPLRPRPEQPFGEVSTLPVCQPHYRRPLIAMLFNQSRIVLWNV